MVRSPSQSHAKSFSSTTFAALLARRASCAASRARSRDLSRRRRLLFVRAITACHSSLNQWLFSMEAGRKSRCGTCSSRESVLISTSQFRISVLRLACVIRMQLLPGQPHRTAHDARLKNDMLRMGGGTGQKKEERKNKKKPTRPFWFCRKSHDTTASLGEHLPLLQRIVSVPGHDLFQAHFPLLLLALARAVLLGAVELLRRCECRRRNELCSVGERKASQECNR